MKQFKSIERQIRRGNIKQGGNVLIGMDYLMRKTKQGRWIRM